MEIIETPWHKVGKFVGVGFGIPFSVIGLLWFWGNGNMAFLYNGILWIVFGLLFMIKGQFNKYKLTRLEKEGVCYDCSVVKIIPQNMIRFGSYLTVRVECVYIKEQLMCGVLSGFYLLSPLDRIDNLIAKIYVDKNNSKRYVVILSGKKGIFTL